MALTSTSELVQATTFIFAGTVLELGASSVPAVPPDTKLITARLDRSLRVDPVLGDLQGQTITVDVGSSETFEIGQQYVFFADSWVHGRGIAVRETAHVDAAEAERVAELVASLPERLSSRACSTPTSWSTPRSPASMSRSSASTSTTAAGLRPTCTSTGL